jgi:phage baseplate assembly protein W
MALDFNELKKTTTKKSANFIYSDLSLDFVETVDSSTGKRDAKSDYDILAVRNSIINIFSTNKGENLLNPDFGSNMRVILFEPITASNARKVGDIMLGTIKKYEPRVIINDIKIYPDIDNQQYDVTLNLSVKNFNTKEISLSGIFSATTFNLK